MKATLTTVATSTYRCSPFFFLLCMYAYARSTAYSPILIFDQSSSQRVTYELVSMVPEEVLSIFSSYFPAALRIFSGQAFLSSSVFMFSMSITKPQQLRVQKINSLLRPFITYCFRLNSICACVRVVCDACVNNKLSAFLPSSFSSRFTFWTVRFHRRRRSTTRHLRNVSSVVEDMTCVQEQNNYNY